MRTELIYLWINKDTHGCFHREGFNFSPRYSVSYSPETRVLRIETLDTINLAFENLFDGLFEDDAIDISTDISVLETMLRQEGLTGSDFK